MKRNFFYILALFVMLLPVLFSTACFGQNVTSYICALPEESFEAELTHQIGSYTNTWSVIHREQTVGEDKYLVHYVRYVSHNNKNENSDDDIVYNLLGIWNERHEGGADWTIYVLDNNNQWIKGSEAKDIDNHEIYGTDKYNFVYVTRDFNSLALEASGFDFNARNKTNETSEYIEYRLNGGDTFKISNNIYHICLYRDWETEIINKHEFTKFTFNESDSQIPHFDTFNPETL